MVRLAKQTRDKRTWLARKHAVLKHMQVAGDAFVFASGGVRLVRCGVAFSVPHAWPGPCDSELGSEERCSDQAQLTRPHR